MKSFVRQLHASAKCFQDASKQRGNLKKITQLKSTPNLYNSRSSASNYRGVLRAKIEPGLYHEPSQASPSGSINSETIPKSFLPKDDPRRQLVQALRPRDHIQSEFAPMLHQRKEKTHHLNGDDVAEIKRLRNEDPEKYTRKALAQKFGVSPLFISLVSSAPASRTTAMAERLELIKQNWHPKRALAREDRKKRKVLWYRA